MALKHTPHYEPAEKEGLGHYWFVSLGLHASLLLFGLVGLVFSSPPVDMNTPPPIYVEFAPVAEKAAAPTQGEAIQTTKQVDDPKPLEPEEKEPEPAPKEEPKPPPEPEPVPEEKPAPEPEPAEEAVPEPPKEEPKPAPEPDSQAEAQDSDSSLSFDKLLKDLAAEEAPVAEGARDIQGADQVDGPSGLPDFAKELTISEFDALRAQLARCWNVPSGARDAENLVIEVAIDVNRDKVVTNARVVDQLRYNTDTFFRAAADSAVRAVRAPQCSPLEVPDDKFEAWQSMIIVFDPREMF